MLYVSLGLALILLPLANRAVHRPDYLHSPFFGWGMVFTLGLTCAGFMLSPVCWLFALLNIAMLPWFVRAMRRRDKDTQPWRPELFFRLSLGAFVAAFGVSLGFALADKWKMDALREEFAYESMEDRLPRHPVPAVAPLAPIVARSLDSLEGNLPDTAIGLLLRQLYLKSLHEGWINHFVNS